MELIKDHESLDEIKRAKQGFVFNQRNDARTLHHATCRSVHGMYPDEYPKYFALDRNQAIEWLNKEIGTGRWRPCGTCGAYEPKSS